MDAFRLSYGNHIDFPLNLIIPNADRGHLIAVKSRLDFESKRLYLADSETSSVFFRDFSYGNDCIVPYSRCTAKLTSKAVVCRNVECTNEQEVDSHLREAIEINSIATGFTDTPDPDCRFM